MSAVQTGQVPIPAALPDRYRIGRLLGAGGMASVYEAHDSLLDRQVAVKVFRARAVVQADVLTQQAEAHLVASLNHHALTTLFDAGVDTTDPRRPQIYLVMEYIPGSDLRSRLRRGRLSVPQVCWLGLDLAEGLDYVHEAGFIHHDIKPANVLLADRRADTRIRGKLTDFGIASLAGAPDLTEFTTGTAAYLSPEQVQGEVAVPQSDTYSLGLVLLEAVSGAVAYPGGIEESAFARLDRQPDIPPWIPTRLATVLGAMTALRVTDRPSLKQVAAEFQAMVSEESTEQRPGALPVSQRFDVLEAPSDPAFEVVTRLARNILKAPIAFVAIVDGDRVVLRSRTGIDVGEVPRGGASWSTVDPGRMRAWTVRDAHLDERIRHDALVVGEPYLRSFAAASLVAHDGARLGSLCVLDTRPREFQPRDLDNLADLAGMIVRELELRRSSRRALFEHE
ncbi:protein kinase [uncultured Amnibacterium sp.]|uniref:protein kinase domain-containing protein n=1 Tax=uncultured Amnibacterium sp. TaxID=1631851 RepID=UPI0035CAD85E